jgi:aspartate aminotransferase-like enzyme
LNDIEMLGAICSQRGLHLCLDCCSSVGTVEIDLSNVYLAASVSGKGLGSFPGLALVFYNHEIQPSPRLPCYLDLGLYAANDGIPFTHSSNLHAALRTALKRFGDHPPYAEMAETAAWLRQQLRDMGFTLLAPEEHSAPAIVTIVLPEEVPATRVGTQLEQDGLLLSYRSNYLRARNWIQISMMGICSRERLRPVLKALETHAAPAPSAPAAA